MTISVSSAAYFFVFFVFLLPVVEAIGSASPIAVVHDAATVCGVLTGPSTRGILCRQGPRIFHLLPNVSFVSISGGKDFLCGLRSGGISLICWGLTRENPSPRRLYRAPPLLDSLTVGENHVFASVIGGGVRWWRRGSRFPPAADGKFKSISSGNGFSCGIRDDNGKVNCWGEEGGVAEEMRSGFANFTMSKFIAGNSHACGITTEGRLVCKGRNDKGQLNFPPDSPPFEFSALALGRSHSCGIRRENGSVLCWGGAVDFQPVREAMEWIVAGGDTTCGVTSLNFSVICWGDIKPSPSVQLERILPGICSNEASCRSCGQFPDSQNLCGGTGVICKSCDERKMPAAPPTPPPKRTNRALLAFAIVGSVGTFAGVCTIIYCLWTGVCRQKKVHNSVNPTTIVRSTAPQLDVGSISKSRSRSRSVASLRHDSRPISRQRSGPSSVRDRTEVFSLEKLAAATKNFSPEVKIGSGSFGTVYKGKLPDGREVAIKRSEHALRARKFQEKESAFRSELLFLSRLHHKHLVSLVGFCDEDDERLLVYEYMENGALFDHLHSRKVSSLSSTEDGVLNSWRMRIKVLLDTARGIEYLHNYAVPPIIHRDIKSSNILLDANWTAKVSDFGLSLNGPKFDGGFLPLKAAGTVGYMDPEYYGLQHLTVKSDVYGLGVVMLEVLTGRRAIFKDADGTPTSVVDYAVPLIVAGNVARVLDPKVGLPPESQAEAVELLAYVAISCVSLESRERPTMTDIVGNLENALGLCQESRGSVSSGSNYDGSYD